MEQVMFTDVSVEDVAFIDRSHSEGCTCEEEVSGLEHEEAAYVRYQTVDGEYHVAGVSALYRSAVLLKVEVDVLHVASYVGNLYELPDACTAVKSLAQFPWQSAVAELGLEVASGKVDSYSHFVVIAMGKALTDVFASPVDTYYDFCLVVESFGEIRYEERFTWLYDGRVGFGENHWLYR